MTEIKLINGDCLEKLKEIEDCSVDSIVTDPPYHLTSIVKRFSKKDSAPAQHGKDGSFARLSKGFMGQEWDGGDIAFRTEVWEECLRVLKPGGHLLAFSGSRTYHRMAYAIDEAGFEIRDQIMWVYGSGFPKSHNVALGIDKKLGHGNRGRAIPTASSYQATDIDRENKLTSNPVDSYVAKSEVSKDWEGWGTALKPAHEPIVLARKPLEEKTVADNVLKYGTGALNIDETRIPTDDDLSNGTCGGMFGQKNEDGTLKKAIGSGDKGRWPANFIHDGSEEWSKYFYCPKANKKDRGEDNQHPTVKPTDLMRYLIKLVTPKNGVVLDPFMGSGSTGKAAVLDSFNFIGIELSEEYLNIAKSRINQAITKDE